MACICGGNSFVARQICRHDIVVDDSNMFIEACGAAAEGQDIYDAEDPYGPYTCLKCEMVYDDLPHYKPINKPLTDKDLCKGLAEACEMVDRAYTGDGVEMCVAVDACLEALKVFYKAQEDN